MIFMVKNVFAMERKTVRINGRQLSEMVAESVKRVMSEKLDIDSFDNSFEDAVMVASNGDGNDWDRYVARERQNPYQGLVDDLVPIYRELVSKGLTEASNYVLKAVDAIKRGNGEDRWRKGENLRLSLD